jgi:hypothetical protein
MSETWSNRSTSDNLVDSVPYMFAFGQVDATGRWARRDGGAARPCLPPYCGTGWRLHHRGARTTVATCRRPMQLMDLAAKSVAKAPTSPFKRWITRLPKRSHTHDRGAERPANRERSRSLEGRSGAACHRHHLR